MKKIQTLAVVSVCGALLTASMAFAEETPEYRVGQGWSLLGGQTVGKGRDVVWGEFGWPGIQATLWHGYSDQLDVGFQGAANYVFEGLPVGWQLGARGQALVRYCLVERARWNLGVKGGLGLLASADFSGLSLPLELAVGIPLSSALSVSTGIQLPMYFLLNQTGGYYLPILGSLGAEYFIHQNLMVTFSARVGPSLSSVERARLAFIGTFGAAYRF